MNPTMFRRTLQPFLALLLVLCLCAVPRCQCRYGMPLPQSSLATNDGYLWTAAPPADARLRVGLSRNQRNGMATSSNLEYPLLRDDGKSEPSCEELRTIWRLTKRAARHSLMTNEIPTRPTSMFGYFVEPPEPYGSFGRIVLEPQSHKKLIASTRYGVTSSKGSFDRVKDQLRRGIFGETPFTHLGKKVKTTKVAAAVPSYNRPSPSVPVYVRPSPTKAAWKSSRLGNFADLDQYSDAVLSRSKATTVPRGQSAARFPPPGRSNDGAVVYGVYNNLGGLTTEEDDEVLGNQGKKPFQKLRDQHRQYLQAKYDSETKGRPYGQTSGNDGYYQDASGAGRDQSEIPEMTKSVLKDLLVETTRQNTDKQRTGFNKNTNGCQNVKIKYCSSDDDCACYGLYTCIHGKCKNFSSKPAGSANGLWHDKPVPIPKMGFLQAKVRRFLPETDAAQQSQYEAEWDSPQPEGSPYYMQDNPAPPSQLQSLSSLQMRDLLENSAEDEQPQILPHHRRKLNGNA